MNPGHVYILGSDTGTLYVGVTSDLRYRIIEHKMHLREGFATRHNCYRLLYAEPFATITEAIAREKQLKGWRREEKVALIRRQNPTFTDLALHWEAERLPPNLPLNKPITSSVKRQAESKQGLKASGSFDSGGDAACAQDDRPCAYGSPS